MHEAAEDRNLRVIAISQEDTDLESHARFHRFFPPEPRFDILADLNRAQTTALKRTTTYFVEDGIVRQVFPQAVSHRATWQAMFSEVDRIRDQGDE